MPKLTKGTLMQAGASRRGPSDPNRPMAAALLDPGLTSAPDQWSTLQHPPLHATLLAMPCWPACFFPVSANRSRSQKSKGSEEFLECVIVEPHSPTGCFADDHPYLQEAGPWRTMRCDSRWPPVLLGQPLKQKMCLQGKPPVGEVKRLRFFILKIENHPPHNPVPPSSFPTRILSPRKMKSQSNFGGSQAIMKKKLKGKLHLISRGSLNFGGSHSPGQRPWPRHSLNALWVWGFAAP